MRAELPWNVAGIPPEAREAARAAARREGLSVGEWLTRRIIAELGEDAASIPDSTGTLGPDFVAATNRRETEAMLARLADAEAEASHTYRRIEEQLRSVGSGLDNAERSQSEMNRAMSRAATEITLAGSEQAHAFDQLGRHMAGLDDRLEKLERAAVQDGLKEAVKGLHQGLSRLADQFGQATARSGVQTSSLARNLEQLALRLVQARADAEAAAQALEAHLGQVEETQAFTNHTIDQILGRAEAQAEMHYEDMAEVRRRGSAQQETLVGMEGRLAVLEEPDLAMEQRLQAIEQVLTAIREELDTPDPHAGVADALRQVSLRLDMAEQNHSDMLAELREGLARIPEPVVPEPIEPEPVVEEEPVVLFEPIPIEEPVFASATIELMTEAEPFPSESAPLAEELPAQPVAVSEIMPDNFAQHAFANHFDMPQDFADALARPIPANDGPANLELANDGLTNDAPTDVPANEQDFLDSARRSAREAAEADARGLLGWAHPSESGKKTRPVLLVTLAAIFFLLLATAAALMLSQRSVKTIAPPRPLPRHISMADKSTITVTPHLQVAQPQIAAPAPAAPVAPTTAPSPRAAIPALADKVPAAANGGNDVAETIMGLRNLDAGDSVAAFQWLEKAALQGQPVAEYSLGTLYERGQGVTANPALAAKWYLAAANQGNRKAMHNLAVAYAEGSAGAKNTQEAARWFAQAAALGLSDSQFNLAVLYERGDGVPQSLTDSYKWYSIAAAGGDAESKARIAILKNQLSATDRQAAERAAQNFRPEPLNRIANVPPEPGDIGG
jgi:localization factor PodJL